VARRSKAGNSRPSAGAFRRYLTDFPRSRKRAGDARALERYLVTASPSDRRARAPATHVAMPEDPPSLVDLLDLAVATSAPAHIACDRRPRLGFGSALSPPSPVECGAAASRRRRGGVGGGAEPGSARAPVRLPSGACGTTVRNVTFCSRHAGSTALLNELGAEGTHRSSPSTGASCRGLRGRGGFEWTRRAMRFFAFARAADAVAAASPSAGLEVRRRRGSAAHGEPLVTPRARRWM